MTKEQMLGEVDELVRTMPDREGVRAAPTGVAWLGRALAVIERWSRVHAISANRAGESVMSHELLPNVNGYNTLRTMLYRARADLQMELGRSSVVVAHGRMFEYFDEVRKIVESARSEVFFVDPYLEADFVARYLPHVAKGVNVRLLGKEKMPALLSAVEMFTKEHGYSIEVRSSAGLHDRFLFVDQSTCHLSGASFKDGARNAPATLTQITDAFPDMLKTYETLWSAGKVER